ncbi:MAG: two component system response regulator [Homoserinimonas sp.]|jgi:DNA-binding NarL/FixJ family response regulator|nr:two component system response regulator [Homoserinimonas sp.]
MTITAPRFRGLRLIVADDDSFTVHLVAGALQAQGFKVSTACTVPEAWALIESEDPHALVTDLDFGHAESGAMLLARVHRAYPWVGLVVLTSHRSPQLAVDDPTNIPTNAVYLVKSGLRNVGDLASAVRKSISGHVPKPQNATDMVTATLTTGQAEVLRMLASGASTRAVAEHRGTTVRAAETMLTRLYYALGLESDERSNARVAAVTLWQQGRIVVR